MIKIKNIKINDTLITCDIFPEDSVKNGLLKIDRVKNEIINYSLPKDYEWCKSHLNHARNYLIDLANNSSNIPDEKLIMWY